MRGKTLSLDYHLWWLLPSQIFFLTSLGDTEAGALLGCCHQRPCLIVKTHPIDSLWEIKQEFRYAHYAILFQEKCQAVQNRNWLLGEEMSFTLFTLELFGQDMSDKFHMIFSLCGRIRILPALFFFILLKFQKYRMAV